jgi:hypothetical protein
MAAGRSAGFWQRLFGLDKAKPAYGPAIRPGHSATGEVVTGRKPDWSRYDECMRLSVVGESHYQEALIRLTKCPDSGDHAYECAAELVPEPDNPHDPFAVKVLIEGEHVGYLSRGNAKRLGKRLRALNESGGRGICMAWVGRGGDNPNLGVNLRLPYDGEILQGKR